MARKAKETDIEESVVETTSDVPAEESKKAAAPSVKETKNEVKMNTPKPKARMGILRSANSYPTQFTYRGENAFISPNGLIRNVNESELKFPLPAGVKFIRDQVK